MDELMVWLLTGLVIVSGISFVRVEFKMNEMEKNMQEAMSHMEENMQKAMTDMGIVYKNNINAVRHEINVIETRFNKEVNKVEIDILELEKVYLNRIHDVKGEMNEIETRFNGELNTVKIDILDLEKVHVNRIHDVKDKMNEMESRFNSEVNKLKTEIRPTFTATFSNQRAIPLTYGEILKFDKVHLNIGEGYDPATGYFTVPKAGIYLVSCTIRSIENKHIHAYIWKNYEKLLLAYGRNWNTGSFSFPINLQKGDLLFVRHDDGPYIVNEEVHGGSSSVFAATFISDYYTEDTTFNPTLSNHTLMVTETEDDTVL